MTAPESALELTLCEACRARFLPNEAACPRCGSTRTAPYIVPPTGTVLAATELEYPSPSWPAPHRLALVEVADAVRLLAVVDGPLPPRGAAVSVHRDGPLYRAGRDLEPR